MYKSILLQQYLMFLFKQFKTYFVKQQQIQQIRKSVNNNLHENNWNNIKLQKHSDSFELIMSDILEWQDTIKKDHKGSAEFQILEDVELEQNTQQEIVENMYVKDFIFIAEKSEGATELTIEQWGEIIKSGELSKQPKKNIYFSIFKGIDFIVRKQVWQVLANVKQMKAMTNVSFAQLCKTTNTNPKQIDIIDKDVPRSASITPFLSQLRNILIAYVNLSQNSYTQGMNLIAGSLLSLLTLQNDKQLAGFQIIQETFQQRVFWVFMGVMKWKKWEHVFEKDLSGLKKMLMTLECLMVQYVPEIYNKIISFEWDLTIFSQFYITILLYNTPQNFAKIIIDLFLLDGQSVIHSLLIRMMVINRKKIEMIKDEGEFMNYFKKDFMNDGYVLLQKNRGIAKRLQDFDINFIKTCEF